MQFYVSARQTDQLTSDLSVVPSSRREEVRNRSDAWLGTSDTYLSPEAAPLDRLPSDS